MSPDNQKPFKINGEIVRSFPAGIGIKFKHVSDTNQVTLIDRNGQVEELPLLTKREVADRILDRLAGLLGKKAQGSIL